MPVTLDLVFSSSGVDDGLEGDEELVEAALDVRDHVGEGVSAIRSRARTSMHELVGDGRADRIRWSARRPWW